MSEKTVYVCDHCGGDAAKGLRVDIKRVDYYGSTETVHACSHECLGQFVQTTKFPKTRALTEVPQVSEKTRAERQPSHNPATPYRG